MLFLITLGKWSLEGDTKWWASCVLFSNTWPLVLVLTAFKVLAQFIYIIVWQRQKNCIPLYPIFSFYQVCLQIACTLMSGQLCWTWPTLCRTWPTLRQHMVVTFVERWRSDVDFFFFFCCDIWRSTNAETYVHTFGTEYIYILHAVRIRCHVVQPDKHPNYNKCAVPISAIVGCSYTACWLWKYYDCMHRKYRSWKIRVYNGNWSIGLYRNLNNIEWWV